MRIGIIGAGVIANKVAGILSERWQTMLYAVASRDIARAQAFAARHGMPKAYGSYEELVNDPDIDIVYVATPHSHHYAHARLALSHGKHVICEKSFTANAKEAKALVDMAQAHGLFLMEALCTRFKHITWSNNMKAIYSFAFKGTQILRIDSHATTPPQTGQIFTLNDAKRIELHVPRGCEAAYRNAPVWEAFVNIIADL